MRHPVVPQGEPPISIERAVRVARLIGCALVVLLAACRTGYGEIPKPSVQMSAGDGLCSSNLVLDANDDVWLDHGCESPTDYGVVGHATASQAAAVRDAFAKLPRPPDESCRTAMEQVRDHSKVRVLYSSAEDTNWFSCIDAADEPVEPYATVIAAMDALPH